MLLVAGVGLGALIALAVCYGLATKSLILGSVEGRWTYDYVRLAFQPRQLFVFLALAAACGALLALPLSSRNVVVHLALWIVVATGSHWLLRSHARSQLETIFVSPAANSFYTTSQEHEPADLLARFNRIRQNAPWHGRSNMPGKTLLIQGLTLISLRTDVLPWLVIITSNLGAILMFGLARDLFDSSRTALYAAVLYLFTPGRVLFFPLMNSVTPLLVLGCAWLLVRWLKTGALAYAVAMGVAVYALVFFEPLPLVMGLLFLGLITASIARGQIGMERVLWHGCAASAAFIATFETVALLTDFNLLRAFRQIGAHAVEFNELEARPYGTWVRANLGEFLFAAGPCQVVLGCVAIAYARVSGAGWRAALLHPLTVVSSGLFAVLITTDLLGLNRGEVLRLWTFLACFFQLPAAYLCAEAGNRRIFMVVLGATLLQLSLAVAMVRFVVT